MTQNRGAEAPAGEEVPKTAGVIESLSMSVEFMKGINFWQITTLATRSPHCKSSIQRTYVIQPKR